MQPLVVIIFHLLLCEPCVISVLCLLMFFLVGVVQQLHLKGYEAIKRVLRVGLLLFRWGLSLLLATGGHGLFIWELTNCENTT